MMKKQILAAVLAAATVAGATVPAMASDMDDLIKKSLTKNSVNAQSTEKAPASGETKTAETSAPAAAAASGAFTGSTPLVQYLYSQFSKSPSSLSVPVKLFSSKGTQQRFDELGNAAIEAYIQNGLTDYVTDFKYNYTSGSSNITMTIVYDTKDAKTRQAQGQALDKKASEIVASLVQPGMSDREKAQALSNYVAQNVKYDFEGFKKYQAGENVFDLQTAYAGLVGGKAICQGFARAYKLLCDKAGIPCVVVFGKTKQFNTAHAWCRVKLDGKWETVDTSNPQLGINHVGSFCIPADVVSSTLIADGAKTLVPSKAAAYLS